VALDSRVLGLLLHFHMAVKIGEAQNFKLLRKPNMFLTCLLQVKKAFLPNLEKLILVNHESKIL